MRAHRWPATRGSSAPRALLDKEVDQALLLVRGDACHFERIAADDQLDAARGSARGPALEDGDDHLQELGRLAEADQQGAAGEQVETARPGRRRADRGGLDGVDV